MAIPWVKTKRKECSKMKTTLSTEKHDVVISDSGPTVLIGERINPSGKKKLAEALKTADFEAIRKEAVAQVDAGAGILDVNVVTPGVSEAAVLPKVVEMVMASVDVPLCIDINDPAALKEALKIYKGKPIVNSVTGEEKSLNEILPLVKEYGTAVIGLTIDEDGIPKDPERRVAIAHKIVERAGTFGIPPEDVIIDCLTLTVGTDTNAALVTLEAILPDRQTINQAFLAIAISSGVTCPTVDVAKALPAVLSTDLILGRDRFAQRYIKAYRQREAQKK
jgi:5-methyltetrahydrofolate--homocysteine methyltransferase